MPLPLGVICDDEVVQASLDFATGADIRAVKNWRISPRLVKQSDMRHRAAESCELARFAAKRWRYYRDSRTFACSSEELQSLIASDPHGEFSFHLKVTADWFPEIMGAAMVRRTWCHHLMIDFLFVHPDICSRLLAVKTVGVQILQSICLIARELKCKRVWGEATKDSSAFYQSQLGRKVEDLFAIDKQQIAQLSQRVETPAHRA
jgi:hypothetical protein